MKEILYYVSQKDWSRIEIVHELKRRGTNIRKLSREAGLAEDTLRNVFDKKWPKAEKIVANAIGIRPEAIWPSRYKSNQSNDKVK